MTNNNIVDLTTFKQAKILVKDLDRIIKFYDLAISGLSGYTKYSPVAESLAKLKNDKQKLKIYLDKYSKFIENKGV